MSKKRFAQERITIALRHSRIIPPKQINYRKMGNLQAASFVDPGFILKSGRISTRFFFPLNASWSAGADHMGFAKYPFSLCTS